MSSSHGSEVPLSAADHKKFIQGLQSGDLIDFATDASLSHWACVQVAIVDTDQLEVIVNSKAEWVKKNSNRIGQPHTHVSTNKHMRAAAQAEAQARAQAQQSASNSSAGSANAASILASMAAPDAALPLAQQQLHQSHSRPASAATHSASAQQAAAAAQGEPALPAASVAAAAAHSSHAAAAAPPSAAAPAASPAPAPAPAAAAAAPAASASASVPAITEAEAKKFRAELKAGDLVDFKSDRHRDRWFLGEVVKVIPAMWGFGSPDVEVFNYTTNDREVIAKDSSRLMPPMTKSAQAAASPAPTPAAAAAHVAHPVQKPPSSLPPIQARPSNVAQASSHAAQSPVVSNQPVNGQAGQPAASPNTPAANGAVPAASPPAAGAAAAAVASTPIEGVPVSPLGTKDPTLIANHGLTVKPGDVADVLDTESKWRLADILSVEGGHALVHYCHWSNKWDEWIPRNDLRIQPPRTKTEGYTGPVGKRPAEFAAAAAVAHKPTVVAPAPTPAPLLPAPRPSYACLAACSWKRVLSTGLSHKEIQTLNELFAQCCHVQDCYEEVLVGKMAPTPHHSSLYSPYGWQSPPPAHAKPTLASVSEQLDKLEASIANLGPTLPSLCQFPLSQCASIAANIRALIIDSEDTARRQLLSEREDLFMAQLNKKFQLVEIASDGSCLFSAVGMGHKIQQHVQKLHEHEQQESQKAASAGKDEKEQEKEIPDSESDDAKASPPPDPTLVLTMLAETADEKLQRGVASKCRNDLSTFFQEQLKLDSAASADGAAMPASAVEHATVWKNKIQSEVKEVLQQESAGKYSDATSKAVWDELSKSPSSASEKGDSAKVSPLSLADTRVAVEAYLKVMNTEGIYGTSLEVEALSEMLQSPIHIYYRSDAEKAAANAAEKPNSDDIEPEQVIGSQYRGPPICLAYYMGNKHYNLLVQREFIPQPPQKTEAVVAAAQPAAGSSSSAAHPAVSAAATVPPNASPESAAAPSQPQEQGELNAAAPAEVASVEPVPSPSNVASQIDASPGAAGPGGVKHVEDHFSVPASSSSAGGQNVAADFDMVEITPGASSTPLTLSRASSTGNTKDKDVDMKPAVDEHSVVPPATSRPHAAAQHSSAAAAASKPLSKNSSPQLSGSSTAVAGAAPLQLSQPSVAPYAPFAVHAPAAASAAASPRPATAPTVSSRVTLSIRFPQQVNDVLHTIYSNIPLRTLHSHPMLHKFHASQLQYFIQDGIDWIQIDPVSTAEELKLKDGSHVGIKLA